VWGLTTGIGAVSFLRYGMVSDGLRCLECMAQIAENISRERCQKFLTLIAGASRAQDQAWSSALFMYAVDDFLFGIKPDMINGVIYIEPRIPEGWSTCIGPKDCRKLCF